MAPRAGLRIHDIEASQRDLPGMPQSLTGTPQSLL
jgi:hypothetical protein